MTFKIYSDLVFFIHCSKYLGRHQVIHAQNVIDHCFFLQRISICHMCDFSLKPTVVCHYKVIDSIQDIYQLLSAFNETDFPLQPILFNSHSQTSYISEGLKTIYQKIKLNPHRQRFPGSVGMFISLPSLPISQGKSKIEG